MTAAYRVFGLSVCSEIELPELASGDSAVQADVTISVGPIDASISAPGIHATGGDLVFVAEDVARYRISGGREIVVDPLPGTPERNVRLFLLGSAFGALLHQRGLLPLHANAVEIGGKAVAFMGESGAGKSTLAAWFHDHGYRVLADDVTVIRFPDDRPPTVAAGLPRLRLWRDAMELTRREPEDFQRSYAGETPYEKFDVATSAAPSSDADLELAAVFELVRGEELHFESLEGANLLTSVYAHTYRGEFVGPAGGEHAHWSTAIRLAQSVPFIRVARPWNLSVLDRTFHGIIGYIALQLGLTRC